MKLFKKWLMLGCLFSLCFWSLSAAAQTNPVDLLQSLADQMVQSLKQHKADLKSNPEIVYSLAKKIVVPHADLEEMAQRVLPPATWQKATPEQRKRFEKEFTNLLVRTYATALADYTNETIKFYPVRGGYAGKSSIQVSSKIIRNDGPSIPVNYRLVLKGSEWKLYDMSVEGVSLLESFRSQFADKLAQGNIDQLIKDLVAHNSVNDRN